MRTAVVLAAALAPFLAFAQSGPPPTIYSFVEANSMMIANLTLKIYRDGARELIDQTRPPGAESPNGLHLRSLYDFAAHRLYAWDLIEAARPCSVSDYPESAAPAETDIVTGSTALMADFRKQHPRSVGRETVNGIPAQMLEATAPSGGAIRVWISDRTNYVVKWMSIPKSGTPEVQIEVSQLSFERPPADMFALPDSCR